MSDWRPWREPVWAQDVGPEILLSKRIPFNSVKLAELADRMGLPATRSAPDAAARSAQEDGAHEH